jgi:hypothetical protein
MPTMLLRFVSMSSQPRLAKGTRDPQTQKFMIGCCCPSQQLFVVDQANNLQLPALSDSPHLLIAGGVLV